MSGFKRPVSVLVVIHTPALEILLLERARHPGYWQSVTGSKDRLDESWEATARREVQEETGVTCGAVSYLASQPWPFPASLMIGARTEAAGTAITLDPLELEQALWLSREELVTVFAGRHPAIRPSRNGAIAHFILRAWLADRLD